MHAAVGRSVVHDRTAETDGYRQIASLYFPRIAVLEPAVGIFDLPAVFDPLFEHTVFVADAVTVTGIIEGCEAVEKTRGEPAESSVSESRVGLFVFDHIVIDAHVFEHFFYLLFDPRVDEVVAERASH